MSRWMARLLTPNRSAKAASVIPGSVRQAWAMASRRSAGAGRTAGSGPMRQYRGPVLQVGHRGLSHRGQGLGRGRLHR
jgi:hypothetical protein